MHSEHILPDTLTRLHHVRDQQTCMREAHTTALAHYMVEYLTCHSQPDTQKVSVSGQWADPFWE